MVNAVKGELRANHIRCAAHSLQLSVNAGLKVPHVGEVLSKGRRIVGHFKHSATKISLLHDAQVAEGLKKKKLIQDVVTRWNSSCDMLNSLIENRVAINKVLMANHATEGLMITITETKRMQVVVDVLQPFKIATEKLGGEKYVTGAIVGTIFKNLLKGLAPIREDTHYDRQFKQSIYSDLERRFGDLSPILNLVAALHPRYKALKYLEDAEQTQAWRVIRREMASLETPLVVNVRVRLADDSDYEDVDELPPKRSRGVGIEVESDSEDEISDGDKLDRELQAYRDHAKPPEGTDPFAWWKNNCASYPHVAQLARKYLCVVGTSVPCERMFSKAGRVATKSRSRLTGEHISDLMFLNSCFTYGHKDNNADQ